jgi:hypothetical protein
MRLRFGLLIFVVLAYMQALAAPQKINSLTATSKSQGTITISDPGRR